MSKSRAARRRASSRRRHPSTSQHSPSVEVIVIEGDHCPICEMLGLTIHDDGSITSDDGPRTAKNPGAETPGSLFDQPPDTSRSDLPWKA